jgi:hypothetical protein
MRQVAAAGGWQGVKLQTRPTVRESSGIRHMTTLGSPKAGCRATQRLISASKRLADSAAEAEPVMQEEAVAASPVTNSILWNFTVKLYIAVYYTNLIV